MASADTPYYELYDEEKNIIIYGIKIEALFPEGFEISFDRELTLYIRLYLMLLKNVKIRHMEKKQ